MIRLACAIVLVLAASGVVGAEKRNVLLICVDDLRPVMGCYGGAAKTPRLDELAKSAAVFTRHYVQWPVCGPSRASMLGGLRPDTTGIYEIGDSWKIAQRPDTHPTPPRTFLSHGYRTLSFGKVFHNKGAGEGYGWSEPPWKLDWTCYVNFKPTGKGRESWRPAVEIYDGEPSRHNDYQTADQTIAALRVNKDRPFFIAAGFFKPHLPFVAPKSYFDLYTPEEIALLEPRERPVGAADHMYGWSEISSYGAIKGTLFTNDDAVTRRQARRMTHAYYACVSFIDAQIGRILDALDANGLSDSTAVVVWGDHGFHLGDHGRWAKHTQFEQAMRSPLMVRLPGQQKISGPTDAIAESVDLYPTLCEFAGLPIPEFVEGESLIPVLRGKSQGKEAAFSQIRPVNRKDRNVMAYSVRTADFRYVEWRDADNGDIVGCELYDHRNDPEESVNVSDRAEFANVLARHEALVLKNHDSLKNP